MEDIKKKSIFGKIVLIIATIFWGTTFVVVKDVVDVVSPSFLIAVRFTVASLILIAIFYNRLRKIDKSYIICGVIIGLMLFIAFMMQTIGLKSIDAGKNAFLTSTYVVFTPFIFWIFSKKRPRIVQFFAVAVCMCGVGAVSLSNSFKLEPGDVITLTSGLFYALQIVFTSMFLKDKDPIVLSIVQFVFVAVLSWIYTMVFSSFPTNMNSQTIWGMVYLAVICTAISFTFQNVGQKWVNPTTSGIIYSFEALIAIIFDILINDVVLTTQHLIGFALIFISLVLIEIDFKALFKGNNQNKLSQ